MNVKQVQSDNEEESRTGAIKKKARTDPFSTLFKRRKNSRDNGKTQSTVHPMALEATPQKRSLLEKDGTKVDEVARNFTIPITLENDKEISLNHQFIMQRSEESRSRPPRSLSANHLPHPSSQIFPRCISPLLVTFPSCPPYRRLLLRQIRAETYL